MSRPRKEHQPLGMGFGEALTKIADKKTKPMPNARNVDEKHKIAFLKDLIYMMYQVMLFQAYYSSCTDKLLEKSSLRQAIHNSILESSLSFVRKLNEFFGSIKDIRVTDYLAGWSEDKWILNGTDRKMLNDRAMHISLLEARYGKQDWSKFFKTYLPKICDYFKKFHTQLKTEHPDYISQELAEEFLHCNNYLDHYLRCMHLDSALLKAEDGYTKKKHR